MENIGEISGAEQNSSLLQMIKGSVSGDLGLGTTCHAALETFHCLNYAAYKFLGVSATEGGH